MIRYAELQCMSNFSFLEGASHPEELVLQAAVLGLKALAITDINSVSGLVRAHTAAKDHGVRLVIGTRLRLVDGPDVLIYPSDRAAYGRLTSLLTTGKRRAEKGACELYLSDLADTDFQCGAGQIACAVAPFAVTPVFTRRLHDLKTIFDRHVYLAATMLYRGNDARRLHTLSGIGAEVDMPLIAAGDVRYHTPTR